MMDPRKIGQFLLGEWDKTSQPLKERTSVLPFGLYGDDYAYGGVKKRAPYESENAFFRSNPHVAGMATEDDQVALNPFSDLTPEQQDAVALNESARVWMRKPDWQPSFDMTPEQASQFASYGSPVDQKSTIAARLISGDTSAGMPTQSQLEFSQRLASEMKRTDYGLEDAQQENDLTLAQYLMMAGLLPEGEPTAPDVLPAPFPMHPQDIESQGAIDRGLPQRPKMRPNNPNEPRPYFDRRAR